MTKIRINNLQILAYHGVLPEEKETGQMFEIDITMTIPHLELNDDISCTVNYSEVIDFVVEKFTEISMDLIETVAHKIGTSILKHYDVDSVHILLRKPNAPLNFPCHSVEVEIHLNKENL
jgi:dihydroneopterin aldolase